MNERKKSLYPYFLIVLVLFSVSCKTVTGTVISNPTDGGQQVTDGINGIIDGQTDIAISGNNIENGISELELAIINGTDQGAVIAEILRAVQSRPIPEGQ